MIKTNDFLMSLKQIELQLRPSKYMSGMGVHHLAHLGRSQDFAGYQQYRPGDDPKDLDWKLFARSDRYYIKQRDTHTRATTLLLLDDSPSMGFFSKSAKISKFHGALLLTFGLGYVLYKQGDAFSFKSMFTMASPVKPRISKKAFLHFVQQLRLLEKQGPLGKTEFCGHPLKPKSIDHVFLISDFLVAENQWKGWLKTVNLTAKECSCFHLIDPEEENPIPHSEVLHMEAHQEYRSLTLADWHEYRFNFQKHKIKLRKFCLQQNIAHYAIYTDQPIEKSIRKVLSSHKANAQ
ncbi:MAG: DUF58 domain-containing protein [SAR324 cluster bacterium]|nr:DUF58 domain-containing protein [SAR324 cluster bacterium]